MIGEGTRLFSDGLAPIELNLVSAQAVGAAVRLIYSRAAAGGVRPAAAA